MTSIAPMQNATVRAPDLARATPQMRKAAQDFEAVFMAQMMAPMFEGTEASGPFGGGQGEEAFRSLLVDQYGRAIASRNGTGIADAVLLEMIRIQEKQP